MSSKKERAKKIASEKYEVKTKPMVEGKVCPPLVGENILKKFNFKTARDNEEIYVYENGVYNNSGGTKIKEEVVSLLGTQYKRGHAEEVISWIKGMTYVDRDSPDEHLINLKNGVYDLKERKLLEHSPQYFFLNQLGVEYNESAKCPNIISFLEDIVGEDDIPVLQEFFGYCLYRDYPIHKAVMLTGSGSNGKSTLLNLLTLFLGKDNISGVPLQSLDSQRFAVSSLYGRLANLYPDLPAKALKNTGIFKMVTGNDMIEAEKKYGGRFSFRNYAKLIFSANKVPEVEDDTDAFFRRWIIINFPRQFTDEDKDPFILEKISTDEEMSGLFNWALEGLERLTTRGSFTHSKSTDTLRDQYERMSSPILAFVKDCLVQDSSGIISKDEVYATFIEYCEFMSLPTKAKNVFSGALTQHAAFLDTQKRTIDGVRTHVWVGGKLEINKESGLSPEKMEKMSKLSRLSRLFFIVSSKSKEVSTELDEDTQKSISLFDTNTSNLDTLDTKILEVLKENNKKMTETELLSHFIDEPQNEVEESIQRLLDKGTIFRNKPGSVSIA